MFARRQRVETRTEMSVLAIHFYGNAAVCAEVSLPLRKSQVLVHFSEPDQS